MTRSRQAVLTSAFSLLVIVLVATPALPQTTSVNSRAWADRVGEIEAYLKSAEVVAMDEIKSGVTKPRRATLAPGGPVESMCWSSSAWA
jgi:hypothetical protein